MTEWGVFEVFAAIVGLFLAIGVPSLKLNSTITRLSIVLGKLEETNKEEHSALWQEVDKHGETINDHETRLCVIEREKK